jgi:hypothetical protein
MKSAFPRGAKLTLALLFTASLALPVRAAEQQGGSGHSWLDDRFHLAVGVFARDQGFAIGADGSHPEEEIDFDEELGVDDDDASGSVTFRWNFGEKWSFWGQAWEVDATGGARLDEDIEFEDYIFREGSFARAGVENTILRAFFGRIFSSGPRHEFGIGAGFHWLEIGAFIEGEIRINEGELVYSRADVSAEAPLPNIGAWFYYSLSDRWLFDARIDWLEASISDYSGGLWNSSVGFNFQAFNNVGFGLNYQYFSLDVDVDNGNWRGAAELQYRGPFLSLTANW